MKEKDRGLQAWGGSKIKRDDEDYFDKLVREDAASKGIDYELIKKVDSLT